MNEQDKQLVFQDLCARLPHHIRVKVWLKDGTTEEGVLDLEHNYGDVLRDAFYYNKIIDIKPYLRPLSSMTEEEREEFRVVGGVMSHNIQNDSWAISAFTPKAYDWLNAHHFDYHGLIQKGLAIEVIEENNPYKD